MTIEIKVVSESLEKKQVCYHILKALPEWFSYEQPIVDYSEQVQQMPFYAAFDNGEAIGFIAVKVHNIHTAEICVMGLLKSYHHQGIGRKLVECAVNYCAECHMKFITVKTVAETAESSSYAKTRKFYEALDFIPLEIFPLYWDEANPCLFLAKIIS